MFKDEKRKILYVGKAKDLKKRVSSYFSNKALDAKTITLVSQIRDIKTISVASEIEAFLLESELIKKHRPFYNIKLVDDKSYPMIEVTNNGNPSVTLTRKKIDKNAKYFGPYSDASALKAVLRLLRRIFPYQSVKNHPKRKCLYYHIGLCPCVPAEPQNLQVYKKNLSSIEKFLMGKKELVINNLVKERDDFSKKEEFENASAVQERIDRINLITSSTFEPFHYIEKPDFYYERIRNELTSLVELLKPYFPDLKKLTRIECYDISNISGKNATGSMVVFENGDKKSSEYRRFKIKTKDTPDDFFMMSEMLARRFKKQDWPSPDLVIIDGGKGQVSAALKSLASQSVKFPLVGLAKKEETIIVPLKNIRSLEFAEVRLPKSTPGINLVRRIRDEAHRFAITYHRLLRKRNFIAKKQ